MPLIERFVKIGAGAAGAQTHSLGEINEHDQRRQLRLRKLTVAPEFPYIEQIVALLTLPSDIVVGPIDIPFVYNATTPVQVKVVWPVLADHQTIRIILADLPDETELYGATNLVKVGVGVLVPIPDAVVACSLLAIGQQLTYYDSTSTAIGNGQGSQPIARPRTGKFVGVDEPGGAVLFHY